MVRVHVPCVFQESCVLLSEKETDLDACAAPGRHDGKPLQGGAHKLLLLLFRLHLILQVDWGGGIRVGW